MKLMIQFDSSFDFFCDMARTTGSPFEYCLKRRACVKDIIESFNIPHTEIGGIEFNGRQTDFSFIPSSQGVLKVDGIQAPFDVLSASFLRPHPLAGHKFIADVNVIRLGRLMILLGFDVCYSSGGTDAEIADISEKENRIVLTRDTDLLKRKKIVFARRIRSDLPYDQLSETIHFFGLNPHISFFSRCPRCNRLLEPVQKEAVLHLLEPKTQKYFHEFYQCPACRRIFWRGSHYDNIKKKMASLNLSMLF